MWSFTATTSWHSDAAWGAVHSINCGSQFSERPQPHGRLGCRHQIIQHDADEWPHCLQYNVAREIADFRAELQQFVAEHLVGADVRADEPDEIIDVAAHLRAFDHMLHASDGALEVGA